MKYLLNKPSISSLETKYVNDVLKQGWLSAEGEHTSIFEKKFLEKHSKLYDYFQIPTINCSFKNNSL